MRVGVEISGSTMGSETIARKYNPQIKEHMWRTNRFSVDERKPKFPDVRDPIFDSGTFPGFDK